jgi:hypothetical protein
MTRTVPSKRKHLLLLVAMVAMLVAQPLLGHLSLVAGASFDLLFGAIIVYLFFILFTDGSDEEASCSPCRRS